MIRFSDILRHKRAIARAMSLILLLPMLSSCINDHEPALPADEETYSMTLNLNTRGLAVDNSGNVDALLLPSQLYIAAYKKEGNEYKFLCQLYNGANGGLATLTGSGSQFTLNAFITSKLLSDVSEIAIAVAQVPMVAYTNASDPDSGHAETPVSVFRGASLSNGLYSYGFNVEPLMNSEGGYYEGLNINGSAMYCMPMFGMSKDVSISSLKVSTGSEVEMNDIGTIYMARSIAKVVVKADKDIFPKIKNVRLKYQYNKVNLLPDLSNYQSVVIGQMIGSNEIVADLSCNFPNNASLSEIKNYVRENGHSNMRFRKSDSEYYFYITEMSESMFGETLNGDELRNLIEVEYDGKIYPVRFTTYKDGKPDTTPGDEYKEIRRNHIYTFNIQGVSNGKLDVQVKVVPWTKHEFAEEY